MSQPLDPSVPPNQGLVRIIRGVVEDMLKDPDSMPLEFRNWLPQFVDLNMLQHGPRHRDTGPDPIPFPTSISAVSATSAFMLPFVTFSDQITLSTTPSASSSSLFWQRQPVPLAASAGQIYWDTNGVFSATSDPVSGSPCLRINVGGLYQVFHKIDWSHTLGTGYGYNRVSFNGALESGTLQWRPIVGNTLQQAAWWPPTASATAGAATGDGFNVGGFKVEFGDHSTGETSTELLTLGPSPTPVYKTIGYLHDKGSDATVDYQYTVVRLSDDPSA